MNAGEKGERLALKQLKRQGYRLLEKNYRHGHHEIDLIMEQGEYIVFVEVKARSTDFSLPREAVNAHKQHCLRLAAGAYLQQNSLENRFCRFDVVEVYLSSGQIEHIVNAF